MTAMPDGSSGTENSLLAQILLEQGKQTTSLAVIETKVDQVIGGQHDHEKRIRSLEQFRWILVGLWLATTIAAGFVGYHIHP